MIMRRTVRESMRQTRPDIDWTNKMRKRIEADEVSEGEGGEIVSIREMDVSELKIVKPFNDILLIAEDVLSNIKKDMRKNGFDRSKPVTIWAGKNVVVDGHTRLKAAQDLDINKIWAVERHFGDENAALVYAIKNQRNRRNLNSSNVLHFVETVDQLFPTGGDRKSIFWDSNIDSEGNTRDSREVIAEKLGISCHEVSACRHILNHSVELKKEIIEINNHTKTNYQVYMASLAAQKRKKKKAAAEDKRREIIKEVKAKDFPDKLSGKDRENLDDLSAILLPSLCKRSKEMLKIRTAIESLKAQPMYLDVFSKTKPVQEFLGSLFVNDFIATLKSFGYKIEQPSGLKVIEEKRPVKKRHPAPLPHCSAARFNEIGFVSHAESNHLEERGLPKQTIREKRKNWRSEEYYARQAEKDMSASRYV